MHDGMGQGPGHGRGRGRGNGRRGGGQGIPLEPVVLAALATQPCHGYDLRSAIEEMTGSLVPTDPGGLYRLLRQMEASGLVTSAWAEGTHGPQRRRYQATAEGLETLSLWRSHLEQRATALRRVINAIDDVFLRTQDHHPDDTAGSHQTDL